MLRSRTLLPLLLVMPLFVAACAVRSESSTGSASNQLGRADLTSHQTVWDAVSARRANWLRKRTPLVLEPLSSTGGRTANPVWVYRDGTIVGDLDVLRNLSTVDVETVEYFDARTATLRWGSNHENGVIHVVSRNGPSS